MRLERHEVERFYRVWFPLLHYVNEQRHLVPSFPATWGEASVEPSVAAKLRKALWEDDALREQFVADNPARLSPADLDLVKSWKYRVAGHFFVFRHLKKYSVFLSEQTPARAYGVLGLVSSIEDIVGPHLPIYVDAVLLPFEDRIIYDSLLSPYSIYFGGGIRRDLNETYRDIQEREGIITTLLPSGETTDPEAQRKAIRQRNQKILLAFQKDLGAAGLSLKMMEEHTRNINAFGQKYLLNQNPPRGLLDLTVADVESYLDSRKANPVSLKRFVQFLRNTYRLDYDQAEEVLDILKRRRRQP